MQKMQSANLAVSKNRWSQAAHPMYTHQGSGSDSALRYCD